MGGAGGCGIRAVSGCALTCVWGTRRIKRSLYRARVRKLVRAGPLLLPSVGQRYGVAALCEVCQMMQFPPSATLCSAFALGVRRARPSVQDPWLADVQPGDALSPST